MAPGGCHPRPRIVVLTSPASEPVRRRRSWFQHDRSQHQITLMNNRDGEAPVDRVLGIDSGDETAFESPRVRWGDPGSTESEELAHPRKKGFVDTLLGGEERRHGRNAAGGRDGLEPVELLIKGDILGQLIEGPLLRLEVDTDASAELPRGDGRPRLAGRMGDRPNHTRRPERLAMVATQQRPRVLCQAVQGAMRRRSAEAEMQTPRFGHPGVEKRLLFWQQGAG